MKSIITPIYLQDAEEYYREFFAAEFLTRKLGQPGYWLTLGSDAPDLRDPVRQSYFEALLGASQARAPLPRFTGIIWPSQPVAWRLTFEVGSLVTHLWAVVEKETRDQIERAHSTAVRTAVSMLWSALAESRSVADGPPGIVCAAFRSGTGRNQLPNLHTTLILFNSLFFEDGRVTRIPEGRLFEGETALRHGYSVVLGTELKPVVGNLHLSRNADVPGWLYSPLDDSVPRDDLSRLWPQGEPHFSQQLFAQWRRCGELGGYGQAAAEATIAELRGELNALQDLESDMVAKSYEERMEKVFQTDEIRTTPEHHISRGRSR